MAVPVPPGIPVTHLSTIATGMLSPLLFERPGLAQVKKATRSGEAARFQR